MSQLDAAGGLRAPRLRGGARDHLLVAGVGLAIALFLVGPGAVAGLAGGEGVDAYGSWWFQWFVARTLADGGTLSATDLLFFPWGKDIFAHTGANLVDAALVAPARAALGGRTAWNLLYVLAIAGNAAAAGSCLLARGVGRAGAVAGALVVGLHPYPLYELAQGRPTQALLAPLVVACFAADQAFRDARNDLAALSAVALAFAAWVYWFGGLFAGIAIAVLALSRPTPGTLARALAIAVGAALLTLPAVGPMLSDLHAGTVPGLLPVDRWSDGDFVLVNAEGDTVRLATLAWTGEAVFRGDAAERGRGLAVGVTTALLCLRAPGRWRVAALLLAVVAAGPFFGGWRNPLYLGMVALFPPAERLYWPVRAASLLLVPAALGAAALCGSWRSVVFLATVVTGEVVGRGVAPLGGWSLPAEAPWACLRGTSGAVIDLPYGRDQLPLVHQTMHGLPMLNGMHERSRFLVPPEQRALRDDNAYLRALLLAPVNPAARAAWTEADRVALGALGYRWVSLRLATLAEPGGPSHRARDARARLDALAGGARFEREGVVVWAPWGGATACD